MGLDRHRGGSGEPLVLVHGIGHTWRGFKPMLPLLEERFDVLAVDLPGFGHSPMGTDQSPEGLADAVEAAMDEAGFTSAREKELGKSVLLGLRWIIRNVRPPEAPLRNRSAARCSPGPRSAALARRS
jgi:pimeloyl-ACP methyl ester carboxylesterase